MNTAQWHRYRILEAIPDSVPQPENRRSIFRNWFARFCSFLLNERSKNSEPQIWYFQASTGEIWWNLYNPTTGQTLHFPTEDEVLIWLDQHHCIG